MKRTVLAFVVLILCAPAFLHAQQEPLKITTKPVAGPVYMLDSSTGNGFNRPSFFSLRRWFFVI
jgi:hypothetical protein